jgi:hypothetical protein
MEHIVRGLIKPVIEPTYQDNKLIGGNACGADKTRPDLCWVLEDRVLHVEIDEHSHDDREVGCELKKIDSASWGLADYGFEHLPTWILRFNPSKYDGRRIGLDARCKTLTECINRLLVGPVAFWDPLRTNVSFLFYNSTGLMHIEAAQRAEESIIVQDVIQ